MSKQISSLGYEKYATSQIESVDFVCDTGADLEEDVCQELHTGDDATGRAD